jgi:hypothetical protein
VQTDRTVPNDKPDITVRDNEKGTCMWTEVAISGDRNVIKKEAEKFLKCDNNTAHVGRKNRCDTSNNRGDWVRLKIILQIPERHTRKSTKSFGKYLSGTSEKARNHSAST